MNLNGGAVECFNCRYASTNLHGIASQSTVVLIFVNTLIFTVKFAVWEGTILNKTDTAMCDDFVTAYLWCLWKNCIIFYLLNEICYLSQV